MNTKDKPLDLSLISTEAVERQILLIRKQRVMLDADLAVLYGVSTKALNQAVKRNRERFPADFMFQLTAEEKKELVTNCDHLANLKYSPGMPYAFTEHGAIMAASVLNSPRAVQMSVFIVRAFIRLRDLLAGNKELAAKLAQHERKLITHDRQITRIVEAISQLTTPAPVKKKRQIGFRPEKE